MSWQAKLGRLPDLFKKGDLLISYNAKLKNLLFDDEARSIKIFKLDCQYI